MFFYRGMPEVALRRDDDRGGYVPSPTTTYGRWYLHLALKVVIEGLCFDDHYICTTD
jgi:hypothetical protein